MPSEPRDRRLPGYAERRSKLRFRDWRFRVRDILAAVRAIEAYTEGMTFEEFAADSRTVDAVVRNLMTIGESTRWIPEPIKDAHREVPWRTLRGMRKETQRDRLLMRWGAAKAKAGRAAAMVEVRLPGPEEGISAGTYSFALRKKKLKRILFGWKTH